MLVIEHSGSIKCFCACFVKQLFANRRFGVQHICRPLASVTCPLPKRKIASETVFLALESLFNTLRVQEPQNLLLFEDAFTIFESCDTQDRMRHQLGAWSHLRVSRC